MSERFSQGREERNDKYVKETKTGYTILFSLSSERMMLFPDRPLSRNIYQSEFGFETVESKKQMCSHLPEKLYIL